MRPTDAPTDSDIARVPQPSAQSIDAPGVVGGGRYAAIHACGRLDWLAEHDVDVLEPRRVHVDLWISVQLPAGAAERAVQAQVNHRRDRPIASVVSSSTVGRETPATGFLLLCG